MNKRIKKKKQKQKEALLTAITLTKGVYEWCVDCSESVNGLFAVAIQNFVDSMGHVDLYY